MATEMTPGTWLKIGFYTGLLLVLLGVLEPLRGALSVVFGSFLIASVTYRYKDPQHTYYLIAALLIFIGAAVLWIRYYFSGVDLETALLKSWGILILAYPIGWLFILVLLFVRLFWMKNF
ncbi:hypothetical protein [Robiginitalea aurantiaca]|uniref:Uncharacterized protein n=1 Tax=Robiginitalea aurantiaca TaxID=3056915 RepID=A0ABT7WAM4_9FLAO|nr:hypothetical protein [Robiginitalea aurantiaca]MDM9629966.1 hypothetical protein [Robiginitalea aurantiaca]